MTDMDEPGRWNADGCLYCPVSSSIYGTRGIAGLSGRSLALTAPQFVLRPIGLVEVAGWRNNFEVWGLWPYL